MVLLLAAHERAQRIRLVLPLVRFRNVLLGASFARVQLMDAHLTLDACLAFLPQYCLVYHSHDS